MAYSQGVARKNGTTFYAINLWSSRSDVSINTSRISWSADVTFGDWYYWGVRLHVAVDGVEVGSWAGACTHSGQKVINVSGTRDVGRGASSRNIQVSAWTTSETVSGYGGVGITTSCATNETIPQKGYLTPRPPKSFAASRVSDTEMGMTWQSDYTGMDGDYPWSNVLIDRRTDDGEWVQIATLSWSALNYTDRTSEAGHKYEYGARASGPGGVSSRVTAEELFTTPNAPTSVTLSKLDGTSVRVGIDGAPKYVDKYNMQTSVNDGEWGASQEVASFPTTITASGKVKVRVQSVKGSLVSAWRESNTVTTIVAPNAPTLTVKPASVVATGSTLKLGWTRNHPDGSAQTSAQVGYTVDSQPEVVADIAGDTSTYTLPASVAVKACAVKVRVRTKGIHEDWGAWSSQYAFKVAVPPSVNFTVPGVDGAKIGDLPLVAQWDVADATGVASQRIELLDEGGSVLHSATPGNDTRKYTFGDGTYRLANATAYRLRLTVRGGSSLSVVSERVFSTSFAEPARPTALVEFDRDAMSQSVTVQAGNRSSAEDEELHIEGTSGTLIPGFSIFCKDVGGEASPSSINISSSEGGEVASVDIDVKGNTLHTSSDGRDELTIDSSGSVKIIKIGGEEVELGSVNMPEFRAGVTVISVDADAPCVVRVNYPLTDTLSVTRVLADGSRWLVADGLMEGQQCIDPLPPLNTDYNYELVAETEAGSSSTVAIGQRIDSNGRMALNFGTAASVAHVMGANAKVSSKFEQSGELYHFADGGESGGLPVWYGTGDMDASGSVSFELHDRTERDRFQRSARIYPVGWFRDVMGGRKRARMSYDESVSASGRATWEESVDMDEVVFEEAW